MILQDILNDKDREKKSLEDNRKGLSDPYFESDEPVGFQFAGNSYGDIPPVLKSSEYLRSALGWVYACVTAISDAVARNPIGLYKVQSNGDIESVDSHASLEVLDKVNDYTTRYDHMSLSQQYLELAGEAPWYMDRGNDGSLEPKSITLLRPDSLSIVPESDKKKLNPIAKYKYRIDAQTSIDINVNELVFLKYPDPANMWRGKGTLSAAARAYDLDNYAEDYNRSFFFNSARPDIVLQTDQKLSDKQKLSLRSDMNRMYQGRKNAHKTMILESGLEAKPFAMSQKDMEFLEQLKFSRDKIFSIFRVHKSIVAITEDVNLANAKIGEYVFAKWTIKPKLERIVAQLNEFYLPMFKGTEQMFFSFDDPVPADVDSRVKKYDSALSKGWMSLNEVRSEENLPDAGELADQLLVPNNFITLDRLGESAISPSSNAQNGFKIKKPFKRYYSRDEENGIKQRSAGGYQKVLIRIRQKQKKKVLIEAAKREINDSLKKIAAASVRDIVIGKKQKKQKQLDEYVDIYIKAADKYEKYFKETTIKIFSTQKESILKKLGKKKVKAIVVADYLLDEEGEAEDMAKLYNPLVKVLVIDRGQKAAKLVSSKFSSATEAVKDYLQNRAYDFSFEMNKTTNDLLGKALAEGVEAGESVPQLRKRVEDVFDGMEVYRSERIARSEVIRGSNFAADQAFKQSGVVDKVQWLATPDDRLDQECADLDGKTIKLGASFGNGLEYPPLHPNCRCTIIPIV